MVIFQQEIFDETITDTVAVYSSAEYNDLLGTADEITVFAVTTDVSATPPTLKVWGERSNDNQHWTSSIVAIISDTAAEGKAMVAFNAPSPAYRRFRVSLSGTSPRARVRLGVTGRTRGGGS